MKTVAIIGATGLIGSHLLEMLSSDPDIDQIHALVRRPVSTSSPKIEICLVDFSDTSAVKNAINSSDAVFCSVGTTRKKVKGDKDAYRKVDFDIPVLAGRICEENRINYFLLVSSIGANSKSSNFYLKLKGEVEDRLKNYRIPSLLIFRPSMLIGKRQESRRNENIAGLLMEPLSFLFPSDYKPVRAEIVAKAMIAAWKSRQKGINIYKYESMFGLISRKK